MMVLIYLIDFDIVAQEQADQLCRLTFDCIMKSITTKRVSAKDLDTTILERVEDANDD